MIEEEKGAVFPILEIISGYLGEDAAHTHENYLRELREAGVSDELILKGAEILAESRREGIKGRLDSLTGLPNAGLCKQIVETALNKGERVALEFNDLLYLKVFNSEIGHERTNEEVFKPIAENYQNIMADYHAQNKRVIIGRYAGDSFLLIIIGEETGEVKKIFDKITQSEKKFKRPEGALMRPRFSRGFATSDEVESPIFSRLIDIADKRAEKGKKEFRDKLEKRAADNPEGLSSRLLAKIKRYG